MNEKTLLTNEKLQAAFKMFDKDGSGMISAQEIKEVLSFGKTLSEEAVNEIIKQVDENGDGENLFRGVFRNDEETFSLTKNYSTNFY